jgi:hypothetical protein
LVLARDIRRDSAQGGLSQPDGVSDTLARQLAAPVSPASEGHAKRAIASWSDAEAERAAIIEKDGGILRAWAEGFARLNPDRPPGDVPRDRWQRFVDDVGLFLDRWAAYAAALGWGPFDLFGCDRGRPFARIDRTGLLWLLNGDKLVALSEDAAGIESVAGARQTYRRRPRQLGQVLAWELGHATANDQTQR